MPGRDLIERRPVYLTFAIRWVGRGVKELGKGGDPNISGIMYLYENYFEVWEAQRGTLTMSSGSVAGVSRRDGGRCAKSCGEEGEKGSKVGRKGKISEDKMVCKWSK